MSSTVGPEAMTSSGSSITSEMMSVMTARACEAARARPPPLNNDRCLRTVLSSWMLAPERIKNRVTACLSANEIPGMGAGDNALPPPEISTSTKSFGPALRASSRMR